MVVRLTEDKVRTEADAVLGLSALDGKDGARSGTGQITTFNQLGFHRTGMTWHWCWRPRHPRYRWTGRRRKSC